MRTRNRYSQPFKEQAVRKALLRGNRTIAAIALELGVSHHNLKNWLAHPQFAHLCGQMGERRAEQWSAAERLQALLDTHGMDEQELGAWCRGRGVFAHQLQSWKQQFGHADAAPAERQQLRRLRQEKAALERELGRKDRALAEAAALLVLQKKYQALWEDEAA